VSTIERARARVADLVATVQRARAARDAATDDAARRGAEAELHLQREALEVARDDLAQLERASRQAAQEDFNAELRSLADRIAADVDALLADAHALHRIVSMAEGRGLRVQAVRKPTLPRDLARQLEGRRARLRRVSAGQRMDFDDAA